MVEVYTGGAAGWLPPVAAGGRAGRACPISQARPARSCCSQESRMEARCPAGVSWSVPLAALQVPLVVEPAARCAPRGRLARVGRMDRRGYKRGNSCGSADNTRDDLHGCSRPRGGAAGIPPSRLVELTPNAPPPLSSTRLHATEAVPRGTARAPGSWTWRRRRPPDPLVVALGERQQGIHELVAIPRLWSGLHGVAFGQCPIELSSSAIGGAIWGISA